MNAAQVTISQIVPQSADWMPAFCGNADGKLLMKSAESWPTPSLRIV